MPAGEYTITYTELAAMMRMPKIIPVGQRVLMGRHLRYRSGLMRD